MSKKIEYFPVDIHINPIQLDRLMKGFKVQFHKNQLVIPPVSTLYLTKKQISHLEKAKRNSRGMRIIFSLSQIDHHRAQTEEVELHSRSPPLALLKEVPVFPRPPKKKLIKKGGSFRSVGGSFKAISSR